MVWRQMRRGVVPGAMASVLLVAASVASAGAEAVFPFENGPDSQPVNHIDAAVAAGLRAQGLSMARPCSDEVFVRRVYLDVIGTLPKAEEVEAFLDDPLPDKREALIETLFKRNEFADYWAMKWCDVLRVKAEFPINLWPNAVQAYHRWVRDAVRQDMPYDQFARALLTSSGSNFRVAPVNFYRAVQGRTPAALAEAVALTFMGTRLDKWPEERRAAMAAFFSRIEYKGTSEWKEEIVQLDPAKTDPMKAVFPDGSAIEVAAGVDPRETFAIWLTQPGNPWFARCAVNRVWAWLLGRGIIQEPDDIRDDNPPVYPEVLALLEKELIDAHYDLRQIYRLILNSAVYQQSSIPRVESPDAEKLFACYPVRRLDAEVLIDALCSVFGGSEGYSSMIPEPFTFVPDDQPTIALADGSITSSFLEMFGRPPRDTGLESERNNQPTDEQRLHMLNSSHIQKKIEQSARFRELLKANKGKPRQVLKAIYLSLLSRAPTQDEVLAAQEYSKGSGLPMPQAAADIAWALINTKEFLYRH